MIRESTARTWFYIVSSCLFVFFSANQYLDIRGTVLERERALKAARILARFSNKTAGCVDIKEVEGNEEKVEACFDLLAEIKRRNPVGNYSKIHSNLYRYLSTLSFKKIPEIAELNYKFGQLNGDLPEQLDSGNPDEALDFLRKRHRQLLENID